MFDLKSPCVNCPFRKGVGETFQLHPDRLEEIFEATAFQCHKTVDYSSYDDEAETARSGDRPQQCAGLMAVLHREARPNQIMQVASRLGYLDLEALDPRGEAYETLDDVRRAHGGRK